MNIIKLNNGVEMPMEGFGVLEIKHNTHRGYEHELLYVFGKDVKLFVEENQIFR